MSEGYTAPPPQPAPRHRPTAVTVAAVLMVVVALCAVVYLIGSIAVLGPLNDAFTEAFAGTEFEDMAGVFAAGSLVAAIAYVLVAVVLLILTVFNNQGRNGARIATWVVGGLGACCGGLSLISTAAGDATGAGAGMPQDPNMPSSEELARILNQHVPGWYDPLILTTTVIGALALIAALILLALPPANEFFRKRPQAEPPGPGYPPVG